MYIVTDKNSGLIIDSLEKVTIDSNKFLILSKGSLIQLEFVDIYEVEAIPLNAKFYKNNKFYEKNPTEIEIENNKIYDKLKELDLIVPRVLEDIIKQSNFTIDVKILDIIKQKEDLRKKII